MTDFLFISGSNYHFRTRTQKKQRSSNYLSRRRRSLRFVSYAACEPCPAPFSIVCGNSSLDSSSSSPTEKRGRSPTSPGPAPDSIAPALPAIVFSLTESSVAASVPFSTSRFALLVPLELSELSSSRPS